MFLLCDNLSFSQSFLLFESRFPMSLLCDMRHYPMTSPIGVSLVNFSFTIVFFFGFGGHPLQVHGYIETNGMMARPKTMGEAMRDIKGWSRMLRNDNVRHWTIPKVTRADGEKEVWQCWIRGEKTTWGN